MVKELLSFEANKELKALVADFSKHQDRSLFNMKLGGTVGKLKKRNKFI